MKIVCRTSWLLVISGIVNACGTISEIQGNMAQGDDRGLAREQLALLLDAAAEEEKTAATESAAESESITVEEKIESPPLPNFLLAIQEAREFTRKLLGLDDSAVKEFHAAIQTARALSSTPEEFRSNIKSAKEKFETAMKEQKAKVDATRVQNAEQLDAIFDATKEVFVACASSLPAPARARPGQGPGRMQGKLPPPPMEEGHRPHGMGRPHPRRQENDLNEPTLLHAPGRKPLPMSIGSGDFRGPYGELTSRFEDLEESPECQKATAELKALLVIK